MALRGAASGRSGSKLSSIYAGQWRDGRRTSRVGSHAQARRQSSAAYAAHMRRKHTILFAPGQTWSDDASPGTSTVGTTATARTPPPHSSTRSLATAREFTS